LEGKRSPAVRRPLYDDCLGFIAPVIVRHNRAAPRDRKLPAIDEITP